MASAWTLFLDNTELYIFTVWQLFCADFPGRTSRHFFRPWHLLSSWYNGITTRGDLREAEKMGPICECGCGGYLPEGSNRRYKRGHSPAKREYPEYGRYDAPPIKSQAQPQPNEWWNIDRGDGNSDNTMTIDDAIAMGIRDPHDVPDEKNPPPEIPVTAAIRRDVTGKLAFMFSMTGNIVQIVDPICGGAIIDNSGAMATKLSPILCQSPAVVAWFRKSSNVMMYGDFLIACGPVLMTVFAHHLAKREDNPRQQMNGQPANAPDLDTLYAVR